MKNILLFDTYTGSLNLGDGIIMAAGEEEMSYVLETNRVVKVSSHTPMFHFYQQSARNSLYRYVNSCDLKLILGTNLLYRNMLRPWPNFNINIFNSKNLNNIVLVGVGSGKNSKKINWYTKSLYKKILSTDFIHSTRDEETKEMLEEMGFKAVNTGCVTLWKLDEKHCSQIKTYKARNVVFTLTDYARNYEKDRKMIDTLIQCYHSVYFWPQGTEDSDYLNELGKYPSIITLQPSIKAFNDCLSDESIDYVGTRLHGGIHAMRKFIRAIIIEVDYRAENMSKTFNLNSVNRENLDDLKSKIESEFITSVQIDTRKITEWRNQFNEFTIKKIT